MSEAMDKLSSRDPKVSVIVAAYNQENYIGRCLRSLLSQTLPIARYEIVVVDDGSNDRTPYALRLFTDRFDSPIRVITNEQNLGLPASINLGIRSANAPYIVRVDSDDFVNQNFLNFLSFYLDVNPRPILLHVTISWSTMKKELSSVVTATILLLLVELCSESSNFMR